MYHHILCYRLKEHEFKLVLPAKSESSFKDRPEGGGQGERNDNSPLITPTTTPTTAAVHVSVATQPVIVAKAVQIDPKRAEAGGYSAVNVLSILPDDVRTEENLEGGSLPPDQAHQMLTDYNKQRQEYEQRELSKMAAASSIGSNTATGGTPQKQLSPNSSGGLTVQASKHSSVKTLNFGPGYEDMDPLPSPGYDMVIPLSKSAPVSNDPTDVGGGEYEDPADALHHTIGVHKLHGGAVVAPKSQISPDKPKKFQLTTNLDTRYTDVYNPGEGETIGQPATVSQRGKLEMTPNNVVNGTHSPSKLVHHYQNTVGGGEGSGDSLDEFQRDMDRQEPIRTSKKHKSAKEEVEFDPTSKRVFRVTSTKRKREANGRDFSDNNGYSNGDSSPDAKLGEKEKQFNMSDENSGGEEYSMVNMADKCKYRTEDDVMKKEGSGIPQRYSAAKSPLKQEVA